MRSHPVPFLNVKASYAVVLVVFVAIISILKGLNLPISWAATHYVLNYDQFFLRRGLVGELLTTFFGDLAFQYSFISTVSFLIMFLAIALLLISIFKYSPNLSLFLLAGLVLFSSPNFVMFVHTVGYFDQLAFLLLIVLLCSYKLLTSQLLMLLTSLCIFILVFIHEAQVMIWGISFCWLIWLKLENQNFFQRILQSCLPVLTAALLGILCLQLLTLKKIDSEAAMDLQQNLQKKADFALKPQVFKFLTHQSNDNIRTMAGYWQKEKNHKRLLKSLLLYFPTVICLLLLTFCRENWYGFSIKRKAMLNFLLLLSFFAPLSMYLFGFDIHRWNSLLAMTGIVALIVSWQSRVSYSLNPRLVLFCLLITCINLSSDNLFFEDRVQSLFPYYQHLGL